MSGSARGRREGDHLLTLGGATAHNGFYDLIEAVPSPRSPPLPDHPTSNEREHLVKFGIFYEHQLPRPWADGAEHRLLKDALDQVELADRLGIDYVWEVEHHFLEEYSHSSAPEVFLAAASQRTSRIRLGHGIVQLPLGFNHTARVAERIATLDLVSDGRVDFGTGEASSETELGGFNIDPETKRDQWDEALDAVTRMFVEEPFAGYDGHFLQMPPRNVVPKRSSGPIRRCGWRARGARPSTSPPPRASGRCRSRSSSRRRRRRGWTTTTPPSRRRRACRAGSPSTPTSPSCSR
ncbi:hypothetical protein BH24ACT3_BH24ACT3_06820 [soil metagenome]